jgi:hypothetical protein
MPKKHNWQGIVKMQQPIATNNSVPHVLVYNKERTIMEQFEMSARQLRKLMGDDLRRYFQAHTENDKLIIDNRVEDQPW